MGNREYYAVLGQAVDDAGFIEELRRATDGAEFKRVAKMRASIDLTDGDVEDLKEAIKSVGEVERRGPGGKLRR